MSMLRPPIWGSLLCLLLTCGRAGADEPMFGYVYTTDLLPRGKFELAQWATWRADQAAGQFNVLEGRTEFEYGVSDRFQLSAYLNYEWARAYHNNAMNGTTLPPATLAYLNVGPDERLDTARFTGISLEGIFRVLSPYTDPVGLAVYVRPSVGPRLRELESRLIVQRNFLDDRMVLAFNAGIIDDRRYLPTTPGKPDSDGFEHPWNEQSSLNLGLAGSYRFARMWFGGLELQNERAFAGLTPFASASRTNVAYYLGPSLHYADEHKFVTVTYLNQLPFASDYAHSSPDFVVDGRNYASNSERYRVRLKFGWYF